MNEYELKTSADGRDFVKKLFAEHIGTHTYARYIDELLAADFACALGAWLKPQMAKLASYEAIDELGEAGRISTLFHTSEECNRLRRRNDALSAALEEVLENAERGLPCPLHTKLRQLLPKAPPAPADEAERPGFEAWHCERFKTKHLTGAPTRDKHGGVWDKEYGPPRQQLMWEAWQARAAKCTCGSEQ